MGGGGCFLWGVLPPGGAWWRPPPPPERLLLRAVRILVECILDFENEDADGSIFQNYIAVH